MKKGRPEPADNGQVIILTGSTGMLGSYLLDRMLQTANVEKIICLNRAEDGGEAKQEKAMHDRGLESNYTAKVEFYRADCKYASYCMSLRNWQRIILGMD